ncbi:MAG: glycosyl hydrolase 2 galactose-binding domain-containing protein [Cellulomonas sp.]
MLSSTLHDGWSLRATTGQVPASIAGRDIPAEVPGCVHTDLMAAGMIADPYLDSNEAGLVWMHRTSWHYRRVLQAAPAAATERVDLVCEGLDTVATIRLGDLVVGRTANMHRTYRFDVRKHLDRAAGAETTLSIELASALERAEAEAARIGPRPGAYPHPLNMVRKMACSFGWDWGPDLQTAGIWRPIRLERWSVARLAAVRPLVQLEADGSARVAVHVDVERSGLEHIESDLTVLVRLGDRSASGAVAAGSTSTVVEILVGEPALWWPVGYGDQPLTELDVSLTVAAPAASGTRLDDGATGRADDNLGTWHRRIGLRAVTLDTTDDEIGTAFTISVNGTPVFAKGANWIPDDHLLTRITRDRLARRLDQAVDANLNLLRVWGGGIYESEDFYELCDERGLMVWQDFPLACFAYPEEEPHRSEFEAEAREHVTRLSAHPSLVLWNGGNENIWGHEDWGWQEKLGDLSWGAGYYYDLFPTVIAELDPTRPYSEGSPSSPRRSAAEMHPNDPDHGTHHQWEVWNRVDYTRYRDEIPRFCSEFGFQAPPAWATLERSVRNPDGVPLAKEDPVWLTHQKAEDGNGKLDRGLAPHLGVPVDFADWHWATQLNQARAVTHAITHYRSWWPRTAGSIVWQLNDCWPVTSWAAIDGDERPKPLWWALRAAYAPRLLTVQPRGAGSERREVLAVVNDSDEAWTGPLSVRRERLDGERLVEVERHVTVAPRSVELVELPVEVRVPQDATREVLVVGLGHVTTTHSWVEDLDLELDPDAADVSVEPVADGYLVTVTARSLVKDLVLNVDRLDPLATVNGALITLPAGGTARLRVRTSLPDLGPRLVAAPVLRTANDLTVVARELALAASSR